MFDASMKAHFVPMDGNSKLVQAQCNVIEHEKIVWLLWCWEHEHLILCESSNWIWLTALLTILNECIIDSDIVLMEECLFDIHMTTCSTIYPLFA